MRSMTGYGRGETHHQGLKFIAELHSVNRKQLDVMIDLPKEMMGLEERVRDEINKAISRGRVHVTLTWHRTRSAKVTAIELDSVIAKAYLKGIQKLGRALKLKGDINMETILRCPGVLKPTESSVDLDAAWPHAKKTLSKALDKFLKMREKEGHHLQQDISKRLDLLTKEIQTIKKLAPEMVSLYRNQLQTRLRTSGIDLPFNDDRLLKEIALFADRSDITEELTRLESHLAQFHQHIHSSEVVGRALDFLAQEIGREINTIGSKAAHTKISQAVILMKSELEKIREQVQNVE